MARQEWPGLDDSPGRPSRNAITEADLVRGYSGLIDRRRARRPDPILTVETVRADYEAALDEEDADGASLREEVRP